jgi:hypothetical protein
MEKPATGHIITPLKGSANANVLVHVSGSLLICDMLRCGPLVEKESSVFVNGLTGWHLKLVTSKAQLQGFSLEPQHLLRLALFSGLAMLQVGGNGISKHWCAKGPCLSAHSTHAEAHTSLTGVLTTL